MIDRSIVRLEGMRKLILDLLDLTRIESGQRQRQLVQVDLGAEATSAIELVAPAAAERGIAIELNKAGPSKMQADKAEIEIILNNLLTNAIKYNRDGGKVDVTIGGDQERVSVKVADTGIGISAEDVARLFQDFVRIKSTATKDILGSGLGLSILKKLTGLYGGDVAVESTSGQGSVFTVTLFARAGAGRK